MLGSPLDALKAAKKQSQQAVAPRAVSGARKREMSTDRGETGGKRSRIDLAPGMCNGCTLYCLGI
jgi:hypothetical protein